MPSYAIIVSVADILANAALPRPRLWHGMPRCSCHVIYFQPCANSVIPQLHFKPIRILGHKIRKPYCEKQPSDPSPERRPTTTPIPTTTPSQSRQPRQSLTMVRNLSHTRFSMRRARSRKDFEWIQRDKKANVAIVVRKS